MQVRVLSWSNFLEELMHATAEGWLAEVKGAKQVEFSRCIRTGGTEATRLWNITVRAVLADLVQKWVARGWGVLASGRVITNLVWADNFWLLDPNPPNLPPPVSPRRFVHFLKK